MQLIEKFEDIISWQKARKLTRDVYQLTQSSPCAKDLRYCGQVQIACVSIMSNIAEGFERRTPKQFDHFLGIAKASCAEVRSLLYVGVDTGYLNSEAFESMMSQANEIARLISGLRRSLRTKPTRNSELGTRNYSRG